MHAGRPADGDRRRLELEGKVSVKLGPIALQFAADVARTEVDTANDRVVLTTNARELRGRGGARATIESWLTELGPSQTRVDVRTELALSGSVAQYGRSIVEDVAGQMVAKFADCLQKQLVGSEEEAAGRGRAGVEAGVGPAARRRGGTRAVLGSAVHAGRSSSSSGCGSARVAVGAPAVISLVVSLVAAVGIFFFIRARGTGYAS